MRVLGIDPGVSGGLCIIDGDSAKKCKIITCIDIPTSGAQAKRRVDGPTYAQWLRDMYPIDFAFIERAQGRKNDGASNSFKYGRSVGYLEMGVLGMGIPLDDLGPAAWKKMFGLIGKEKEHSRQKILHRFPMSGQFFARKLDHNRAESALIALAGLMMKSP